MGYKPPPKFQAAKSSVTESPTPTHDNNALWRVPKWFHDLDPMVLTLLQSYHTELIKFNAKVNLISRSTERDADEVHFADSILASKVMLGAGLPRRVFDIGSGNGLPGLVLAIMDPGRSYVLVESDVRKCEFMKHVVHVLSLSNVEVLNERLESLDPDSVICAVSRGFASISKTVLASTKIFVKGGVFIHLKGNSWSKEVAEIPSQLIATWSPKLLGSYVLPVSQAQRAVVATVKIS